MIHPDTELRFVNLQIGFGVFATAFIPKGTLLYVKDELEIEISPERFNSMDQLHQSIVEKYSYIDQHGTRIISWDHAKYVNHRCDCNSMSTGYGFEIAIRDIEKGEEITDEYGLFNIASVIPIECQCPECRTVLLPSDHEHYYPQWDELVKTALARLNAVKQPLMPFVDTQTQADLQSYLDGHRPYRSVLALKYKNQNGALSDEGKSGTDLDLAPTIVAC